MNQIKNFSISEALKFGFKTFVNNLGLFMIINAIFLVFYLALIILYMLSIKAPHTSFWSFEPLSYVTPTIFALLASYSVLYFILEEYYLFQITRYGLDLYDNKKVEWTSVFEAKNFFSFFGMRCLFIFRTFLATLLLIVPGIYVFCKYVFTGFSTIDGKAHTYSEDKAITAQLTSGVRWKIFGFQLILHMLMGIASIGIITAIFIPAFMLANVYVYRTLFNYYQQQGQDFRQ